MKKYILINKTPVECKDILEWGRWFQKPNNRLVKYTELLEGAIRIATVFMGIDQSFNMYSEKYDLPLLFETMICGGSMDEQTDRYSTWEESEIGHDAMVEMVQDNLKKWDQDLQYLKKSLEDN